MILVHCFLRKEKKRGAEHTYLMADSSASKGYDPLYTTPEMLFEVDPTDPKVDEWAKRATDHILAQHKVLDFVELLKPKKTKGIKKPQVFDLTFNKKPEFDPKNKPLLKRMLRI